MIATSSSIFNNLLFNPELALTGFVKIVLLAGSVLYAVFALLVIRQIQLMRSTVETSFSTVLFLIGVIHFVISVVIVFYFWGL